MEMTSHRWDGGRLFIGGLLIALGLVFLLMNLEVIGRFSIWRFWPLILVAIGINKLFQPFHRAEGFWLLALGIWMQWNVLDLLGYSWGDTWPAALILLGIYWMWESFEKEARRKSFRQPDTSLTE